MKTIAHGIVVLGVLLAPALVFARPGGASGAELLRRAHQAHYDLDYQKARVLLKRSLRAGDHDRASLAGVYELLGRIAAAYDRPVLAYQHYRRMVALGTRGPLPKGLAPKIVAPFQRAVAESPDTRGIETRIVHGTPETITVAVSSDPLHMTAGGVAVFGRAGSRRRVRANLDEGVLLFRVPRDAGRRARIYAVDRFGNRLAKVIWRRPATENPAQAALAVGPMRKQPPPYARWRVWGAAAIAAGGVALYYGLRAREDWARLDGVIADSSSHRFDEATRLEKSGRRNQRYSNISTAAALGLAGVSLYLRLRSKGPERTRLGASVTPQGASVSLLERF
jgi:hypothetical protein